MAETNGGQFSRIDKALDKIEREVSELRTQLFRAASKCPGHFRRTETLEKDLEEMERRFQHHMETIGGDARAAEIIGEVEKMKSAFDEFRGGLRMIKWTLVFVGSLLTVLQIVVILKEAIR